jgi:hypothetical protein
MSEAKKITAPPTTTALERIIIGGDLAQLSAGERVNHYMAVCKALRLDWRTRPFDYLKDRNGKLQMYARKDCTEQLRRRDNISLSLPKKEVSNGVYVVTSHAETKAGRHDEDIGAVPIDGLRGEMLANAMLKATTKAKRRVTLSICGVGLPDESEIDSIPGAVRVAAELPEGAVPSEGYPAQDVVAADPVPPTPEPPPKRRTWAEWLDNLELQMFSAQSQEEVDAILAARDVQAAQLQLKNGALKRYNEIVRNALARFAPPEDEITGEDRLGAD